VPKDKASSSGVGVGKKKGRPSKDHVPAAADGTKSSSGLLTLGFLGKILTAIYRFVFMFVLTSVVTLPV
jgi:hypothetical protein